MNVTIKPSTFLSKPRLSWMIPAVLAVVLVIVLIVSLPSRSQIQESTAELLIYTLATAFALYFGVWLAEDEISVAHMVGVIAFLTSSQSLLPLNTWMIFLGALLGGLALNIRWSAAENTALERTRNLILVTSRVTLSFYAAAQVYISLNGGLPFNVEGVNSQFDLFFILIVYSLVYVTVYFSVFLMEIYIVGKQDVVELIRTHLLLLAIILFLPVPFAILSVEIVTSLSVESRIIQYVGFVLTILGLHALSRSEYQLRKQLNELRTLSVVTRAVRAHLELDTLLKTIYLQVSNLLGVENFTIALYDPDQKRLEFPLIIRHGKEEISDDEIRRRLYHNALIDHVLETGAPLLISHNVQMTAHSMHIEPPSELFYSWMGVPLLAGVQKLGIVTVASDNPNRQFSADDLRLLNIVAASASIAIENAQLYRLQTERAEQMAALNNIASLLSGTLSPETVLDTVISSASALCQANAVAVYLFMNEDDSSDHKENLPLIRSAGLSNHFTQHAPVPLLLKANNGAPLNARKPMVIGDVKVDPRATHLREMMTRENMRAQMELPLVIGDKVLGILVVYFEAVQTFKDEFIEMLRTFSTQAAQAIDNAHKYATTDEAFQRSVEQLLTLASIGRQLTSTLELKTICDLILEQAARSTGVDAGAVVLYDYNGTTLHMMAQRGYPDKLFDNPAVLRQGISGQVLSSGQVQMVANVDNNMGTVRLMEFTRSQLSVPFLRSKEIIGYITLESSKVNGFSQEDSHFVSQLANQAVIAIDNARLFERITEARDRLQVILDTMDEAILLINAQGKIVLANPSIKLIGLQPTQLIDREVSPLLEDDSLRLVERLGFTSRTEVRTLLEEINIGGVWRSYEPHLYTWRQEHSTLYIQRLVIPVRDEHGKIMGALLVFYNKTEEQELNRARDEFSRMIVHDLRSPLTAVTTSLKLLRDLAPKNNDFYSIVDTTTDASRRAIRKLLGRVDSLLDISKMESGRLGIDTEIAELSPIVDAVRSELTPLSQELGIIVSADVDDQVPVLNIDADKVERLLLNLVDNALKYSPMNSAVWVKAYAPGTHAAPPKFIRVDVMDSGPGVPDSYKENLFDSFVQVEGRRKVRRGVGLGLTFCKLVAEAHGGRIWIEDNPEGGSVFSFTLPIVELTRLPEDEDEFTVGL